MTDFFKKHTLITGTLLLTATGFATRILGFFYRIFLSRTIGAEGLGIYHMVHPIYGICFALCAGSIQTAISRFVAANVEKGKQIFRTGLVISLTLGFSLTALIIRFSPSLAHYILMEDRCASLLPFMAISVPFSAVHACLNGYYYGTQKTRVPALSQIVEQTVRMAAVFLIADILTESGRPITVELAVTGHLIGELAACLFSVFCFCLSTSASGKSSSPSAVSQPPNSPSAFRETAVPLMTLALPLMGNRLVLNVLSSAEAIWIPGSLSAYGLSSQEALSVYGVLTGMAMPFILFPSAITNSMAVLLLPTVAEAQADGNESRIAQTISMALRYSLYMGILCIGVFTLFGPELGVSVFRDPSAGLFMQILAWLCPFLYLATTMGSILNGLGKTSTTFLQNAAALVLRLAFVLAGIPSFGIMAYLWGMLASELLLALLHLFSLKRLVTFSWNATEMIIKPAAFLIISVGMYYAVFSVWDGFDRLGLFMSTTLHIGVLCLCYGGLLTVFHLAKRK
ncbi:MAG: oligosaccharide flippase family protein [Hungatella sp.]|nr:oligosaccharide flippase family protein [Hungatella sp.]